MTAWTVHDETPCLLGEGAFWHPERGLFWFDILGRMLHGPGIARRLPDLASAAGWLDRDRLLVARRGALVRLDLATGEAETVAPLVADDPSVRPNDGRADPWGGFWIGTMGVRAEPGAGAIWRLYRGELRRLVAGVSIPNATAFSPDGHASWTDTASQIVRRQRLAEADGWPLGEPEIFLDLRGTELHPDGAVFDAEGNLWVAFWGTGRVAAFDRQGREVHRVELPARQTTCPAFGGEDLSTLFVTSAAVGLPQDEIALAPEQGRTFKIALGVRGLPEPRVRL
jgi:sugar lactone lactonase YvrE